MSLVIREAVEGDYEALCEIIDQVDELHRDKLPRRFRAAEGPVRTREFISNAIDAPDIGLFVAEIEPALTGFVHVIIRKTPDIPILVPRRYAVVDNLAVRTEHRRHGIGHALMERVQTWARAQGATSIELRAYAFNRPAIDFYRKLGYDIVSHHMTRWLDVPEPAGNQG